METAQSEALRAFGDSEVYIEKFIENPRHVEMQIFGDTHGNVIYLAERECSVQRRHQKVLEEAPCSFVDPDMRRRMGEVAVQVAKAANYCNAGTVEFLVDADKNFYFLEMNTRLQVEHPVTEMVTGIDLVQLQLRVAAGEPLPSSRRTSSCAATPWSCASTPRIRTITSFPSPGRITRLISPSGPGIRRDSGMYEGWVVPLDYDPLLAKLIAYGEDRTQVINRLRRALAEYFIGGIKTNLSLFRRILLHPDFQAGRVDTGFLDRLLQEPRGGRRAHRRAGLPLPLSPLPSLPSNRRPARSPPAIRMDCTPPRQRTPAAASKTATVPNPAAGRPRHAPRGSADEIRSPDRWSSCTRSNSNAPTTATNARSMAKPSRSTSS